MNNDNTVRNVLMTSDVIEHPQQYVNRRNTETFAADIQRLIAANFETLEALNRVNKNFASLQERMNALEQQLIIQKVQLTGLGPSVRGG